jgi:hypothetical protein
MSKPVIAFINAAIVAFNIICFVIRPDGVGIFNLGVAVFLGLFMTWYIIDTAGD